MKRQLHCITNENHRTSNRKRRKITDCKNKKSGSCAVHKMQLYYASNITKTKYDQCPKCHTLNNYESMHFIYLCTQCTFYCCNFCMADEYNAGKAIHLCAPRLYYEKTITSQPSTKRSNARQNHKEKHNICVGSKLLIADGAVDDEGNDLGSYELHTVKRIDEENFAMTEYGEIDVTNNEYFMVDNKCKEYKKGQLVASRWPLNELKWAQYYVGSIVAVCLKDDVASYKVMFKDGAWAVTKVISLIQKAI